MRESDTSGEYTMMKAVRRNLSPRRLASLCGRMLRTLKNGGLEGVGREVKFRYQLLTHGELWERYADIPLRRDLRRQRKETFPQMPLVSVVCPLYNTPEAFLREMLRSVQRQSYQNWELVLVNASGPGHPEVGKICAQYAAKDSRLNLVRVAKNEGIAGNTNIGLNEAQGEYIALMDHDDVLQPHALYQMVKAINETGADLLYSDEVVLSGDLKSLKVMHLKPDYGPDTLRGCNYIAHLLLFSRLLLHRAGEYEDPAYDGAQDYDLVLRLTEKAERIHHIPQVLYFWRVHEASTASDISAKPEAFDAGARAVAAHLKRLDLPGSVERNGHYAGSYRVRYDVWGQPLVSVLVPNKDSVEDLALCLSSLYQNSGWPNMEVLVLENNSTDPATEAFYQQAEQDYANLRVLRYKGGFNFAAICNFGARRAKGDHLLLLNNDIEITSPGFVREMLSYSQRPDVGAVGAKLFYPDGKIQHGGLIIGIGGTAGTSHKGHPGESFGLLFRLVTTQNYSAVTGASLMIKARLYKELGGMDEKNFAVAFNDVDLCLRLREQGYWNVFTPFATGIHYESKSRGLDIQGPAKERFDREAAAFKRRHAAILEEGDPFYNVHYTLELENFAYR